MTSNMANSNMTTSNMAHQSEDLPGFRTWFPIMMGLFGLIMFGGFGVMIYFERRKTKRRRLKNLREGKWVRKSLEGWFSDPETTMARLTSRQPGHERTLDANKISDFYATTQDFLVEFFALAKEQKDEECIYMEMGTPWCRQLRHILYLRKQALAKVSEEISNMPMRGERFMAVRDLYWEHKYLQNHIKDFWSNGWPDHPLEYPTEEKYGSFWVDAESELEDLSRKSIERVFEAASKDWAERSARRGKRFWKFTSLLGYSVGYFKVGRAIEAQSRELDD
ncbi:hypothetical protein ONS95_006552 [Cadophora gregata]|uniref:uncharacterized protein n=1 Tax=Cadophora gregata TaxID=51156 RepID=UPI0026DBCCD2|nr:uncharacterized protein ONS95_006552 [Cadophora gregata]KAK0101377.1 hypothetical protein ONS95_006552 [Cadophora gregata]